VNEVPLLGSPCDYALVVTGGACPPPRLDIAPVPASQVRLFWPSTAGGYLLESTPSLLPPTTWTGVPNEAIISGGKYNVTNNSTGTSRFYRLHKP